MNDARKRRPLALAWAIALSAGLHLAVLPFVRLPANASQPPEPMRISQDAPHRPPPIVTPAPRPIVRHVPRVVPRPVIVRSQPHVHSRAVVRQTHARAIALEPPVRYAHTGSNRPVSPPGPAASPGTGTGAGSATATADAVPQSTGTPAPQPAVTPSLCAEPDRDARVIGAVTPDRPDAAAQLGAYGTVDVRIVLSAEGDVRETSIEHSSGFAMLDNAAREAAAKATYAPAMERCHAVAGTYLYRVDFSE